jgi:hypothetical protein
LASKLKALSDERTIDIVALAAEWPDPAVGLHQCRSLLQGLLSLRAEHRTLQREYQANEDGLAALQRAAVWARDSDRLARLRERHARAIQRKAISSEKVELMKAQVAALQQTITDHYESDGAQKLVDVRREISNLQSMNVPHLAPPADANYTAAIRAVGIPAAVGTLWQAIGEGERLLALSDSVRGRAAMMDYLKSLQVAKTQAVASDLDATDQLDAAVEAVVQDQRNVEDIENSLRARVTSSENFSGSFGKRITILIKEYALIAERLGNRSQVLSMNLRRLGITLEAFPTAELLANDVLDEQILSDFSTSLANAAMEFEDIEAVALHTTISGTVSLKSAGGSFRGDIKLNAPELAQAWIESLSLLGPTAKNCQIEYQTVRTKVVTSALGVVTSTSTKEPRQIPCFIAGEDMHEAISNSGGILSNTHLPLELAIVVPDTGTLPDEIRYTARICGLSQSAHATTKRIAWPKGLAP